MIKIDDSATVATGYLLTRMVGYLSLRRESYRQVRMGFVIAVGSAIRLPPLTVVTEDAVQNVRVGGWPAGSGLPVEAARLGRPDHGENA
jgi:hypothetical protein